MMVCFLLEYTINNMLLPGQVENWVTLIDLGRKGLGNLPISSLKQVLNVLQTNFRCRLGLNFIVNPPTSIRVLWSCIKPFLDETTVEKVKFSNTSYSEEMLQEFNPNQVEEKYGGKAPNALNYWPPTIPDNVFSVPGKENFSSTKDSYLFHNPHLTPKKQEANEKRQSINRDMIRKRTLSWEADQQISEKSLEDLENNEIAKSDPEEPEQDSISFEEPEENLINSQDSLSRNYIEKDDIKPQQKINPLNGLKNSEKIKVIEEFESSNKDHLSISPLSGYDDQKVSGENKEVETPKKLSPPPIGIIMEDHENYCRCSEYGCCNTVQSNCLIA